MFVFWNKKKGVNMKVSRIIDRFRPKLVKIHADGMYKPAAEKLEASKNMLENYAKHNKIKIDIYGGLHALENDEFVSPIFENKFCTKVQVVVKDLKTKKDGFELVTGQPDVNETNYAFRKRMIHDSSNCLEQTCNVKSTSEDGLLRRVYRAVDYLTQEVKNK